MRGPDVSGRGRERWHVVVLSGAFTAIFTAYLALQNLQSSLNQESGLGIIGLSAMYACIIISGILAPAVLRLVGEKRTLVIAFLSHIVYTATNFYPRFETLLPSSILLGLTAGPMWTAQSVYLADRAVSYAGRILADEHVILTRFNGIFFAMYETTQITGNLISSLVLQQGNYSEHESNATIKYCGRSDCPREVNATKIEEPETRVVYILMGVFLALDVIGVLLTVILLPPLTQASKAAKVPVLKSVMACGRGLADVNLALLVPLIMFMAMEQGILWTDYTKVNKSSFICMYM